MSREFPNALIGSALPAHLYAAVAVPRKLIRMSFRHRMACGHGAPFLEPWLGLLLDETKTFYHGKEAAGFVSKHLRRWLLGIGLFGHCRTLEVRIFFPKTSTTVSFVSLAVRSLLQDVLPTAHIAQLQKN